MHRYCLLGALLVSAACATAAELPTTPSDVVVRGDDPVITIDTPCSEPDASQSMCQIIVTRTQFDQLCDALQPDMSPAQRLKVANAYARNLRMAVVAEKRGLDKTDAFEQEMHYARLQLLAQDLERHLQTEAHRISDADLAAYYAAHEGDFETAVLDRIFVPHAGQSRDATTDVGPEAMVQLANEVRTRLLAGEQPDQLQREVFQRAQLPVASGSTRIDQVRRNILPPHHDGVMALTPGEVLIVSDPQGAHFVYRMVEKNLPPLALLKAEIGKLIATQRYSDSSREFAGNAVFSDAYFNPAQAPLAASARHSRTSVP